jgi:hypothetical protein
MDYNYKMKEFLSQELHDPNKFYDITLCVYQVNTQGKLPFLSYFLTNDGFGGGLDLPILPVYSAFTNDKLIDYANVYLSGLMKIRNFEDFKSKLIFDGYYQDDTKLYMLFDITNCNIILNDVYSTSSQFVLMDEMLNSCKFCNIPIQNDTTSFFIQNPQFIYLYDTENDEQIEIPSVGFVGKTTETKLKFTVVFGESACTRSALMGSYYYFTNFRNAFRSGGWLENKGDNIIDIDNPDNLATNGGIVRFALFSGTTKYIDNHPDSPEDKSNIKQTLLSNPNIDFRRKEALTIRISDHDGVWSNEYNSVYIGSNLELDDGSYLEDTPILVLKDYDQQVPLSYHFVDKKTIGDKFDPNNYDYKIM